ncbi:Similar to LINE-1 retrotransposable element ORF2 protein (Homo sapiens) [Cotesia congregata]|uniref:Similar to LINE-1 retrotransposable element ORF2 protein (Homo sapiens) n=1 Tax=Cotesia congregata TaxID=51543 RepID=A0A8J2HKX2_COTCN|nr:Similar to LINE-1 retrotransposable element ORF2 protein (Homo sapiens) [Cotesia congregata]
MAETTQTPEILIHSADGAQLLSGDYNNNNNKHQTQEDSYPVMIDNNLSSQQIDISEEFSDTDSELNITVVDTTISGSQPISQGISTKAHIGRPTNAELLAKSIDKSQTTLTKFTKRKEPEGGHDAFRVTKKNTNLNQPQLPIGPHDQSMPARTAETLFQHSIPVVNSLQDLLKQLMIWREEDKQDTAKFKAEVLAQITRETDKLTSAASFKKLDLAKTDTSIVFWNARGLPEPEILLNFKEGTIINISETWRTERKTSLPSALNSFNKIWSPAIKDKTLGRPSGGLVSLMNNDLQHRILSSSRWWLIFLVTLNKVKVIIASIYFNPSCNLDSVLEELNLVLDDILLSTVFDVFVIGGDFNARLGLLNEVDPECTESTRISTSRKSMDKKITPRGSRLNNFMEEHGFVLLNGRCQPDTSGNFTFFGPQGLSVVDLAWVNLAGVDLITEFRVDQSLYCSDHYPIMLKLATNNARQPQALHTAPSRPTPRPKWNQEAAPEFTNVMKWSPLVQYNSTAPNANSLNKDLLDAIQQATETSGMLRNAQGKRITNKHKPWFDKECSQLKSRLSQTHNTCRRLNFSDPQANNEFLQLRKIFHNVTNKKKKEYRKRITNDFAAVNDTSRFWAVVRSAKRISVYVPPLPVEVWNRCHDNAFVLQSALQIHLRQPGASCFGLFVDCRRAFDSIPHDLLWVKLNNLGVSEKMIKVIQNLYAKTKMRVRVNGDFSNPVDVTTGVLQGEILSPLLFVIYISDIVSFFRRRDHSGIQLTNKVDLPILLYADDLVILTRRLVDVHKALRILGEYCDQNGLEVNTSKTKIVPFAKGGLRKKFRKPFNYKNSPVEVTNTYMYLGIPFNSTATGRGAAEEAVNKTNRAAGTALGILSRLSADSWAGKVKIYNAIVRSTLLYLAGIWGLSFTDTMEKAQVQFFKKLLQLPACTPGYAVRLEVGVSPLAVQVLDAAIRWASKVLKLSDDRLPKICFLRLLELSRVEDQYGLKNKYPGNWVSALKSLLKACGYDSLFNSLSSETWESRRQEVVSSFAKSLRDADYKRYSNSNSCQIPIQRPYEGPAKYLKRCPYYALNIKAQLRLATKYACNITFNGITYRLSPRSPCRVCELDELETTSHFLSSCPRYQSLRNKYLTTLDLNLDTAQILSLDTACSTKTLAHFVMESLVLREKLLTSIPLVDNDQNQ